MLRADTRMIFEKLHGTGLLSDQQQDLRSCRQTIATCLHVTGSSSDQQQGPGYWSLAPILCPNIQEKFLTGLTIGF